MRLTHCPSQHLAGSAPYERFAKWKPSRQPAKHRDGSEVFDSLTQFECTQVLSNDFRHAHTQSRRNVLQGHLHLSLFAAQQVGEVPAQGLEITARKEVNRQSFFVCQTPEIRNI